MLFGEGRHLSPAARGGCGYVQAAARSFRRCHSWRNAERSLGRRWRGQLARTGCSFAVLPIRRLGTPCGRRWGRLVELGIFAKAFPRLTLEATLDAVLRFDIRAIQFNFSSAGMPTIPRSVDESLLRRIRKALDLR